jgi:hypothetical protein
MTAAPSPPYCHFQTLLSPGIEGRQDAQSGIDHERLTVDDFP